MWPSTKRERDALDRHITGNYGENQFKNDKCAQCGNENNDECAEEHVVKYGHDFVKNIKCRRCGKLKGEHHENLKTHDLECWKPGQCTLYAPVEDDYDWEEEQGDQMTDEEITGKTAEEVKKELKHIKKINGGTG